MSYYEDRIKALEARIEEMAMRNRMNAIPVEAKLMVRIGELNKENARLKAEVERLRNLGIKLESKIDPLLAEVERLKKFSDEAQAHIAKEERKSRERLDMAQEENARLTKAGDAMAEQLNGLSYDSVWDFWNAAKEGKQS